MQGAYAAELEVERRLSDYARARLTPDAGSKARSRARVMREARLAFEKQAAAHIAAEAREKDRPRSRRIALRRGATLLLAAGLSIGMVGGAFAASNAGGPLYDARIWLEEVTLPGGAVERAAAELSRLEARMAELEAAVRSGDRAAAAAALAAYEQIADEAVANASGDAALTAKLTALLDRHVANFKRVADQVPAQAAEVINLNIERAILHNDAAIERIQANPAPGDGQQNGGSGAGPGPNPGQQVAPAATPKPQPTPKADPTPKPHPTVNPQPTPQPTPRPTPKPQPTPKSPKSPSGQADR